MNDRPIHELDVAAASSLVTLSNWSSMARHAFAANTLRAWRADWEVFAEFCLSFRLEPLPSSAKTVRDFVFECLSREKKPATIRRYVSTIGVRKLALKEMGRKSPARQRQSRGLTWAEIELFLTVEPRNLRDIRDRALVCLVYNSMCRRDELVNLRIEDIEEVGDGSGSILIRRSKTDTVGEGAMAYLSPMTMRLLQKWTTQEGIREGHIFVRVMGSSNVGAVLTAQNVTAILRKVGQWIGLSEEEFRGISGHSARVGAAQDLRHSILIWRR